MSHFRNIFLYSSLAVVVGVGYVLYVVVTPGEERKKQMLKNFPESNPVKMEETRRRNALVMQVLREAAETPENIAREMGRTQK